MVLLTYRAVSHCIVTWKWHEESGNICAAYRFSVLLLLRRRRRRRRWFIKRHKVVRLKTHGVENRRRFSESKTGTNFRIVCHAKTTPIVDSENFRQFLTPIRTCYISRSIFGSTWQIETVVIGSSSLFSFGLFVNSAESVNKHIDYIFFLFLLRFANYMNA